VQIIALCLIQRTFVSGKIGAKIMNRNNQEIKADKGKPQCRLVPPEVVRCIAKVREYGLEKYGSAESWRTVEVERYQDAMYRHLLAYIEDPIGKDEESELPHLWHLACNVAFLCELQKGVYENESRIS
jgi:hypothetical protein